MTIAACGRHRVALDEGRVVHIPAIVVAQAWRDGRRRVGLGKVLGGCRVDWVGLRTSKAAGILCGKTGTSDVVDATAVVMATAVRAIVWDVGPRRTLGTGRRDAGAAGPGRPRCLVALSG